MKKIYLLVLIALIFTACTKDDANTVSAIPPELIGKWHQVSERQVSYTDGKQTSVYEQTNYTAGSYVQYNTDGTVTYNQDGQVKDTYKYSVKNNMLTLMDNTGKRIDADSKITVTAKTLNLHQDVSIKGSNESGTIDYDFVRVN
ncbi:MAG: lipocalin family protein [Bacteroidota bacterium]